MTRGRRGSKGRGVLIIPALLGALATWPAAQRLVPRTWEAAALASMEVPLATPDASAVHASPEFYGRIPVRPIYRSYPIYAPGREPAGYFEGLARKAPEIVFDSSRLTSEADWAGAGEAVFDAPIGYGATFTLAQVRDPAWYARHRVPLTRDGVMPFSRYVVRRPGVVEVGSGSCLMCHARVMPDGTLLKGAQGNFPVDRIIADNLRRQMSAAEAPALLDAIKLGQRIFFSMPWLQPDPMRRIDAMSLEEIAAAYDAIPPGVTTRVNLSLFTPAQIPDLIGVHERRHLDHTGIVMQRSIADLMRYIALVQGANSFDRFGRYLTLLDPLPDPRNLERYSDEQLYALARFLYALEPPPNPHKFDPAAARGQTIFVREGCAECHTPPLYTSNALTPAIGFSVPAEHLERFTIINRPVGTDLALALRTRKGTGYYKVPALKGVWYRGPLQHGGAAATLEDWCNPSRLARVPGHRFGLSLGNDDRRALIAFLRTL